MKHLPIGTIRETKYQDKVVYTVSLFHNHVHEVFAERGDALELMRLHADAFLKNGETDAICVEYYHLDGAKHYLMIDAMWGNKNIARIHEQTKFEYVVSHSLYFRKWSKRRMINERRITSSDVLRSTVNFRPWWSAIHMFAAALIVLFSTIYLIEAIRYLNLPDTIQPKENIVLSFSMFLASLIGTTITAIAMQISRRKIMKATYDYAEINWRRWYKMRITWGILAIIVSAGGLWVLSAFAYDYLAAGWTLVYHKQVFAQTPQLLVSLYSLFCLFIFIILSMLIFISYTIFHKQKLIKKYFLKEQRKQIRKWLWTPKMEKDVVAPEIKNFFVLPPKASEYAAAREIALSQEIRIHYAPDEFKSYREKSISHFRNAMKSYIALLESQRRANDNLSKNNK